MARCLLVVLLSLSSLASRAEPLAVADAGVVAAHVAEPELPRAEPPPGVSAGEELDVGWALVRTLVVLGLVLMLAWLTLNVGLRRLLGIKAVGGARIVQVLERVQLDPRRSLFVIEAAGQVLLVGGADGSLGLIATLDATEVARLRAAGQAGSPQVSPFLQQLLGRQHPDKPVEKP